MELKSNTKPLDPITYDPHDPVLFGLQFGNATWHAVNAPPLSELRVIEIPPRGAAPFHRPKGGR